MDNKQPDEMPDFGQNDSKELQPTAELHDLLKEAADLKIECSKLSADLDAKKERLTSILNTTRTTLEAQGMDSVRAHGYLFYKKTKISVQTPKTPEEKQALFEWLKERGLFVEMVSVNSATLNSFFNSEADKAAEKGNFEFRIPGVGEPKPYTTLEMKRN